MLSLLRVQVLQPREHAELEAAFASSNIVGSMRQEIDMLKAKLNAKVRGMIPAGPGSSFVLYQGAHRTMRKCWLPSRTQMSCVEHAAGQGDGAAAVSSSCLASSSTAL